MPNPTATSITVEETLLKLDTEFASVAKAVVNGEFALWVGSGISRQAPNLGTLIERAIDYVRVRAIDSATTKEYLPALEEALRLAEIDPASVTSNFDKPFSAWPERQDIVSRLWKDYSRVLDIRIAGTSPDFILWEAIDIREAFRNSSPPAAEHLCIAILILERAFQAIASANWDGFIEAAVEQLSDGVPGVLQVVVDPDNLRGPAGHARLLKFHGCIVNATREPAVFRRFLTGSSMQIMDWPENSQFSAMENAMVGLAISRKTIVMGLSIQDNNLKLLFARAKNVHAWPWPPTPAAPAHVFCEDTIQQGQRDVLRISYGEAYNVDPAAVHKATLFRAWGEKTLIALVLKVLFDKLTALMELDFGSLGKVGIATHLGPSLRSLRDVVARGALPAPGSKDLTTVVNDAIKSWSRLLSLFRHGHLPAKTTTYEILSSATPALISMDPNAQAAALGRLAIALALLQYGRANGFWELHLPASSDLTSGAMTARAVRPGGTDRSVFVVKSASDAIALKRQGALTTDGVVVIHADDVWRETIDSGIGARRVRAAPGRTGRVGETHVSLGSMLQNSGDCATLQEAFIAEMML